jgi:hypothetical protein
VSKRSLIFVATLLMPAMAVLQTPTVAQTPKPITISGPKASAGLFDFFTGPMKMVPDYGMSKGEITFAGISCKVPPAAQAAQPPANGYQCTLFQP